MSDAFASNAAAREVAGAAKYAALAAGQAVAVAHVAAHDLGAAAYAIRAARAAVPEDEADEAGLSECRWQRKQLPSEIFDLVIDDQRRRNAVLGRLRLLSTITGRNHRADLDGLHPGPPPTSAIVSIASSPTRTMADMLAPTSVHGGDQLPDDWDAAYTVTPPWDIGRPQRPFVELAEAGHVHGTVLELGCGTGEHTLLAAELGLTATGIDIAPTAIAEAQAKAQERDLTARFLVHDALSIDRLGETFDVVLDCGFFHVLSDDHRKTCGGPSAGHDGGQRIPPAVLQRPGSGRCRPSPSPSGRDQIGVQ